MAELALTTTNANWVATAETVGCGLHRGGTADGSSCQAWSARLMVELRSLRPHTLMRRSSNNKIHLRAGVQQFDAFSVPPAAASPSVRAPTRSLYRKEGGATRRFSVVR